jgi:Ca2+/Na+ antiporter
MGLVLSILGTVSSKCDEWYNELQQYPAFFAIEVVFSFYLLIFLALLAEKYLLPSLLNISKRYNLSKDWTGILVAVGNLIPELAMTMLSFMQHGVKMTEFGVACNIGCASFTLTMVPGLAVLLNMPNAAE